MKKFKKAALAAALMGMALPLGTPSATAEEATNPFFQEWKTPHGLAPFSKIENAHYMPAFERAFAESRADIDAIANNPDAPTFENTIAALDKAGKLLNKVAGVFYNLTGSHTNPEMQEIQATVSGMYSRHTNETLFNKKLFERVDALYQKRDSLGLNAEQARMLWRTHLDFTGAGANLDEEAKAELAKLNEEISGLTTKFGRNVLGATNAFEMVVEDEADLAGLPDFVIAAAASTAEDRGQPGKWMFTATRSSFTPFMTFSTRRDLREKLHKGYMARGEKGSEFDNTEIVKQILQAREKRAKLLGYKNHAEYQMADRMMGHPDRAFELLNRIWEPALERAKEERAALQEMVDAEGGDFELAAWDWWHYAEKVRKARYDLDEQTLKPYFVLDNVLQGAFHTANKLWGLTFKERTDIDTYHPDVRTFEVYEKDGTYLGLYLTDHHARASKRGGAWNNSFRSQKKVDGVETPIVVNVMSFPKGSGDVPALLSADNVGTLFHEFGHAMHTLMSDVTYDRMNSMAWDFVEFPSQIFEGWAWEPDVLRIYAKHYKTGEVIPESMIERLQAASKFNQGFATVEYVSAALMDMAWHTRSIGDDVDVAAFEKELLDEIGLLDEIVVRYRTTYFNHAFGGAAYAAGYYTYLWSEVLSADAYATFAEEGIFNQEVAARLRHSILEPRGARDPMEMFEEFKGRPYELDAILEARGLTD
ncbi:MULTISPECIES: M3 family metallopeptidase [Kordiimonas]|jgi:peptidyl-dipeptidase Dcp|uniref:M3 family metallopeptidase n=1 Tax=Kordiimonas TaxID=288021 RepID=UPI00257D1933|nr:M3 family metallopeptidase [Kordiimonas sp. UBA4487]